MGFTDWLFGSAGKTPADYQTFTPNHNQIVGTATQGIADVQNRGAPQMGGTQIAMGPQDQWRQMQMQQAGQLQGIASGQQQGAGELAAQRQIQNALAGQQAMARMQRGNNAGMGMLGAARQSAGIGMSGVGMGQQAAMQDQMGAQQMLTGALQGGRGQDIGLAGQQATLNQQQNQANLEAQLRTMGMNDQQIIAYMNQMNQQGQAELGAQAGMYGAGMQNHGVYGTILSAGGAAAGAAMMSDRNVKTDIKPAGDFVDAMLDALKPYTYSYKDEKHGKGPRAGIMAQDLEASEIGKHVVYESADGKALDVNKALSAALAGNARLNERLRAVEARG